MSFFTTTPHLTNIPLDSGTPRHHLNSVSVASVNALTERMQSYFSEIKDPRVQRTRAHLLVDILIIGILSVIAGGRGWEDMETYAVSKQDWL